ncbi:MAG: hypothetical protein AAF417_20150 [Pseudomonadota bacterium]
MKIQVANDGRFVAEVREPDQPKEILNRIDIYTGAQNGAKAPTGCLSCCAGCI